MKDRRLQSHSPAGLFPLFQVSEETAVAGLGDVLDGGVERDLDICVLE